MFPRWRGLTHFGKVMSVSFSDGSKWEDLSKVTETPAHTHTAIESSQQISVFILHNSLLETKPEYHLLKVLQCHVEIDLYASLEVHTERTIAAGKERLARFYELIKVGLIDLSSQTADLYLQEYLALEESDVDSEETKNWDFPKMHSQLHLFNDIIAKGVTRNYNTKTNESRHRPIKRVYMLTNFKGVAEQVSSFCNE